MSDIHQRLQERLNRLGSQPKLTTQAVETISQAFATHPEWADLYLLSDGSVIGGDDFRGRNRTRMAQFASMQTHGIPCLIGRQHSQLLTELLSPATLLFISSRVAD